MTERLSNPSNRNYKWKAGAVLNGKEASFADRMVYYDKEKKVELTTKPFEFAVLGISFHITGTNTEKQGRNINYLDYFSTEVNYVGNWKETVNTPITVRNRNGVVAENTTIKRALEELPNAKMGIRLYIWNYETNQIESILTKGTSAGVVRDILFQNDQYKGYPINENVWKISGEERATAGSSVFFKPVFTPIRNIDEAGKDKKLVDPAHNIQYYLNEVAKSVVNAINDGKEKEKLQEYLDKEPSMPDTTEVSGEEVDLSDIPF